MKWFMGARPMYPIPELFGDKNRETIGDNPKMAGVFPLMNL